MIGKARQERLWEHLIKLEEETGGKLRTEPKGEDSCPVHNFAPDKDAEGLSFERVGNNGRVCYRLEYLGFKYYHIYDPTDSAWWINLSDTTKREVNHWIKEKIKEEKCQK